jgi:hypothetical protein
MDNYIVVQYVSEVYSQVATELAQQLSEYIELRDEERGLRGRVGFLEKKAAQYGPLRLDVDLAMLLEEEQTELGKIRRELELLESQLQTHTDIPFEQRTEITASRLEQLLSDVTAKREQLLTYQDNINYLEEKQAKLGLGTGVDLVNELKLTRERLNFVKSQLFVLEQQIEADWGVELGSIQELTTMSIKEIRAFAHQIVEQKERPERERKAAAVQKYDELVRNVLQELRDTVYRHCSLFPFHQSHDNPSGDWEIYLPSNSFFRQTKVEVSLLFDRDGNPVNFQCERNCSQFPQNVLDFLEFERYPSPRYPDVTRSAESENLSRESLIEALMKLHASERRRRRWQFWLKPLPDSWLR